MANRKRPGRASGHFAGDDESERVWQSVQTFVEDFPEGVVVIGGVAVFLHTLASGRKDLGSEFTHDADFMVDRATLGSLRDLYQVTPNRRLHKYQVEVHDVEFDLYLESQHHLRVDYPEVAMAAVDIAGLHVAHKQHLIVLKLAAYQDRRASSHGRKDARDLTKLMVLSSTDPLIASGPLDGEDSDLLTLALDEGVPGIARGNAHLASRLRKEAQGFLGRVKRRLRRS